MEWTRYKLALILFAAVVALGASVAIAEFNHRVRPEVPLYAFKLENYGHGSYQVEFLGEKINFALPVERVMEYGDSENLKEYREQAAEISESVSRGVKVFLSDSLIKLNKKKEVLREGLIFYSSKWEDLIPLE